MVHEMSRSPLREVDASTLLVWKHQVSCAFSPWIYELLEPIDPMLEFDAERVGFIRLVVRAEAIGRSGGPGVPGQRASSWISLPVGESRCQNIISGRDALGPDRDAVSNVEASMIPSLPHGCGG